jgi:hypothetical protein
MVVELGVVVVTACKDGENKSKPVKERGERMRKAGRDRNGCRAVDQGPGVVVLRGKRCGLGCIDR